MKRYTKKILSILLAISLFIGIFSFSFPTAGAKQTYASLAANKYKIRLLVFEVKPFDAGNKAFGGGDGDPYVNFGSQHIADNEDWCRVDYKTLNGTGSTGSAYITLYDRDGDGRYNVISAWGSSGGYFPNKDGILIDGFPTHLYAQYYKAGNSWTGNNGQFRIFLQIASLQNGQWVWSQGTNEEIGDAVFNDSFNSDKQATYGGGTLDLYSAEGGKDNNGIVLKAEGDVPASAYPAAVGNEPVSAAYDSEELTAPKSTEADVVNSLNVDNYPTDQYGVKMAAQVDLHASVDDTGIEQGEWNTVINKNANLEGGTYNSLAYNSQYITTNLSWPQKSGVAKTAVAGFTVVDYKQTVRLFDMNGEKIDETDYYYGCTPSLPEAKKAYDAVHYINVHWSHSPQPVSDTSQNTYTLQYETREHIYNAYEYFDINYHNAYCSVEPGNVHSIREKHRFNEQKVAATCTQKGYTRYLCEACGYYYDTDFVLPAGHLWDAGTLEKEPTCLEPGSRVYTCSKCSVTKRESIPVTEHDLQLVAVNPTDKTAGGVCYTCTQCHKYWKTVYSQKLNDYDIPDETPLDTREQALAVSDVLPAPYFNIYTDKSTGYDYSTRGAALKYVILKLPDYQPLRFTESVRVPENVSRQIGESGNVITDIGIIYSQTNRIGSIENFEIGKTDVFKMSVKDKNEGVYNGSNWGGVSKHESADGTHLTMNLVVNIDYANWKEEYCARAYITYNYNGFTYTVYDEGFSSRSVAFVAQKVVENTNEPQAAREYCQSQILDNL